VEKNKMDADKLREIFNCRSDKELGEIFNRDKGAVSAWRIKGLPAAIERRAYEIMTDRGIELPGKVAEPETHYTDPLRHALEDELNKLPRKELAKLLHQLLEEGREGED